jgi:hypothetical protein
MPLKRSNMPKHFLLAAILLTTPAAAQPVSEQAISDYVESHAAATHLGKIARWEDNVCASIVGLPAGFTKFIIARVKEVAIAAGAPVDADASCKPNVQIIFTTKPQPLLDGIRANEPVMLGYYDNSEQAEEMAKITHPVQSWYETATVDLRGKPVIDSRHSGTSAAAQTGSHLGDGLRSAFYHVTIVADPSKLGDHEIGALADYIAMLALSSPQSQDTCTDLSGILNLTITGCHADAPLKAMTANDSGYLHGLYHIAPGGTLRAQKDGIAFGMKEMLAGH